MTYKSEETNDAEDFNLSILLENIKRNKIIISSFTSLTFILSILYLILKTPIYEGKFQILLNPKSNSTRKALQAAKNSILKSNPQLSYIFGLKFNLSKRDEVRMRAEDKELKRYINEL